MEPQLTCPAGHRLENRMCVTEPMMTCPAGFNLVNNICVATASSNTTTETMATASPMPPPMVMNMQTQSAPAQRQTASAMGTTETYVAEPMSAQTGTCPEGYMFSSSDNMCYPLKN